jgi:hypothetical protein
VPEISIRDLAEEEVDLHAKSEAFEFGAIEQPGLDELIRTEAS